MKKLGLFFLGIIFCERLFGATLYVDLNSTAPAAPFNSWASASTNIQAAVNAAATGDTILVTNGHYLLNAEILVAKQVTIQSINGPETTIVDGQGSVRCFNLGDSACTLSGLTITNGYNGHGGGIYCDDTTPVVTNCTITGNVALFDGGGMEGGTAYHCIITGNWARSGGGMSGGTAHYCTISGNSAQNQGGGMGGGTAHHCTISGNSGRYGGGMVGGTAYHCIFSGNTAREGGGMKGDTAYHCTFSGNSALQGGGMHSGTANNCTFSGNSATEYGGGMVGYTANNCTFSGNSATEYGGGMVGCTANNCIVWYNTAPSEKDLSYTTARYSCSPDLIHGVDGNMTNAPAFVDAANGDYHLLSSSPCIAAGNAEYATGTDLDGGLWLNPPSMGCYEYYAADAVYVSPDGDDAHDGLSWATAKATIQAGVDAQNTTDGVIYVSSGTYALTNEIVVAKQVTIQSVSGPETTIVDGQGSVRCFNLGQSACTLSGLTIMNGYSSEEGGGIYCDDTTPVVNNCILSGNSAVYGGGMCWGTANNCIFSGNSASYVGGGIYYSTANNCTISGNSARGGGGMVGGTANNCTISGNSATEYGGGMVVGTAKNSIIYYNNAVERNDLWNTEASYSCSPDVTHGADGNITNAPMLVSMSHIAMDSPCRSAGTNFVSGTDIDGEAWANPPSMGCDEPSGSILRGDLSVGIVNEDNQAVSGYAVRFLGMIAGNASMHIWDFGDGAWVTNTLSVEYEWDAPGSYDVVLTAYNADWPNGVSATQLVEIVDGDEWAIHISPDGDDAKDGLGWETAKATIQSGVQECYAGGRVLVGSGTYALTNEIVVDKAIRIIGVDGPESTVVNGQGSVRCFNLGTSACVVEGMTITNGYSSDDGGGIYCIGILPVVTNCILSGNSGKFGGGMRGGTADNCTISGNSASQSGGGIYDGTANNCILSGNSAEYGGGGMSGGTANNCTISGNSAGSGGGMRFGTANNSIIYYNNAVDGNDLRSTAAFYSCSPDVVHGVDGNITNAPMLVSTSHIAMDSPCIGAGNAEYATGTDIDGEAWLNPPSMGCDEYSEAVSGPVSVETDGVDKVLLGSAALLTAEVEGAVSLLIWDFDDGTVISNVLSLDYVWTQLGSYDVVLTAYNNTWPDGVSSTQTVEVLSAESAAVYVAVGGDDANDGLSWATAKATIQAGVDAQGIAEGWILVSNGTYAVTNEITVNKAVVIRGVNGPENTIIDGGGVARCLNLGNTACLVEGLTITNGFAGDSIGGGIYCIGILPVVTNCTISGNSAYSGGGINGGTANNCTISGNSATRFGGGMRQGTANNCILSGNSAKFGGGMSTGTANNCTISGNSAEFGAGMREGTANNCTISDNVSSSSGGGLDECTANYCTITGNTAVFGGGLDDRCTANYCTISDNSAESSGGGMNRSTANNCTISGNTAEYGGGMDGGTANNCVISGNTAGSYGGGMYEGTANNCTISGNTARLGAGIYGGGASFAANNCTIIGNIGFGLYSGRTGNGTANNCIVWYNIQGDLTPNITARYSCSPDLIHGVDGNITNAPAFVDAANGDYRLLSTSPCINRGDNALVVGVVDLDGLPRIAGCFVDMGAYEFQGPFTADMDEDDLPDEWERSYFTSGAEAPNGNADLDGLSNWDEYIAGTDPSDAASCLAITNCCRSDGFTVEWGPSVTGRLYRVLWSDSLTNSLPIVLQDNIEYPQSSYTDTEYDDQTTGFYRVEVRIEE